MTYAEAMSMTNLTAQQLHRAAEIREQTENLEKDFASLLAVTGDAPVTVRRRGRPAKSVVAPALPASKPKRRMSRAARAKMAAAATARWAKIKEAGKAVAPAPPASKPKRKVSKAGRARLSAAAKKRWAAVKAAGKKSLSGLRWLLGSGE
jgi:hypothetical protein